MKDRKRDKESMCKEGLLTHKEPFRFIEGPSVFTILRQTRGEMGAKELRQACDQPEKAILQ